MKWITSLLLILSLVISPVVKSDYPQELKCLTDAIYYEAQGEPLVGQIMVAQSVINRKKDNRWPSTICGVVYQKKQYSFTLIKGRKVHYPDSYALAKDIAKVTMDSLELPVASGVNHYLRCDWRDKVSWWESMEFLGQIGNHCFYKG